VRAPLAPEDLTELIGAIADNAVRYARRQIRFDGGTEADGAYITIEDDGPGINPALIAQAMTRGLRLDERGGHGLGLSIAQEIVDATGGAMTLSRAALGGLRIDLRWPRGV